MGEAIIITQQSIELLQRKEDNGYKSGLAVRGSH